MKAILASILLVVSSAFAFGAELTNGVFYLDTPTEAHLIAQNGAARTNHLIAGKTYMVDDVIVEFESTNKTMFYLSGGPIVEASSHYSFSVNVFDQEVKNFDLQPRQADFGIHNINITFTKGDFVVIYPNASPDSSLVVSTPYATYQLGAGRYFFRVTEKSVVVFVLEGMMMVHGDKNRVEKTDKGKLSIAVPLSDPLSGVDDRWVMSMKNLKQEEIDRFGSPILLAERRLQNIRFVVINGRVIGVLLK